MNGHRPWGAFESPSLIRKRNQTKQLQAKLLISLRDPGSELKTLSLPDQSFLESINYEHKKRDFGAAVGRFCAPTSPIFPFSISDLAATMNPG
jgi:hypothetical protein